MTEHEKMLAGKIYDPFTEGLPEERANAHRLSKLYNDTFETETEKRAQILAELLPHCGENVYLQGPIYFDFGTNTQIGKNSYANFNLTVLDICKVTIGEFVFLGPNVSLLTPKHPLRYQDRNPFVSPKTNTVTDQEYGAPITIGDNCWIGGDVTVCGGVTIGEGCVIGAGSVVTRDIPPNSLAFGNPCRVVRAITEKDSLREHPELFGDSKDMR
ncbi:MAG: sugar O-acetyltransferase [Victivallaceae bacterium]|nr:sugar O-acetyltransferase [Victivallaceae bacterium]